MIKKNTKIVIFDMDGDQTEEETSGGLPLSIGEKLTIKTDQTRNYEVTDKTTEIIKDNSTDQTVNIIYTLKEI